MQDLKIPFGLDKTAGMIREIGDVPRGRACGCVCPSCLQGLMAKQGDVLVWHFSHDKDAVDRPVRECDLSFESCCRLYTIDLALNGAIKGLRTPAYSVRVHGIQRPVCQSKNIPDLEYLPSNRYDLEVRLQGGSIAIFLAYSGRGYPPPPEDPRQGLLVIDVESIRAQYAVVPSGPGVLRELITATFLGDAAGKRWLHHPREQAVIDAATPPVANNQPKQIPAHPNPTMQSATAPRPNREGHFLCIGCSREWTGMEYTDRTCKACGSHLLSQFTFVGDG